MSSTLNWKPLETSNGHFNDELKRILGKKYFGGDGSCWDGGVTVDDDCLEYLAGLRDGGNKDAGKLMKVIAKHGPVELFLEY